MEIVAYTQFLKGRHAKIHYWIILMYWPFGRESMSKDNKNRGRLNNKTEHFIAI